MERKNKLGLTVLDWLVIIVETSYSLTIIRAFTFDKFINNLNVLLVAFMVLSYMVRFGIHFRTIKGKMCRSLLLFLLIIYFIDIVQNLYHSNYAAAGYAAFFMINTFFFYQYIYMLITSSKQKFPDNITIPYTSFCLFNVILVLLAALLIGLDVISATSNPMSSNTVIEDNYNNGVDYYFPGGISIALSYSRLFSDSGIPVLTGWAHEPHVLLFLIVPSFFLLFGRQKSITLKLLTVVAYAFVFFLSTSTTAIICLAVVVLIDAIWNFTFVHNKTYIILVAVFFIAITIWGTGQFAELIQAEIYRKVFEETGSLDYSTNLLTYVVSPAGIIGQGNFPEGYGGQIANHQIGYITFLLDIVFYALLIITTFKIIIKKDIRYHYIGLAALYLLLHGMKLSVQLFAFPLFINMVFMIGFYFDKSKEKKII